MVDSPEIKHELRLQEIIRDVEESPFKLRTVERQQHDIAEYFCYACSGLIKENVFKEYDSKIPGGEKLYFHNSFPESMNRV